MKLSVWGHHFLSRGPLGACSSRVLTQPHVADDNIRCDEQDAAMKICTNSKNYSASLLRSTWHWPSKILERIDSLRNRLKGLRFDVGFDYAIVPDSNHRRLSFLKSAFYGTF